MSGASLLSVATAVPDVVLTSDQVKEYFPKAFQLDSRRLAVMEAVVDNARVNKRHLLFPLDYTIEPRSLETTTGEYKTHAIRLGRDVAQRALEQAGVDAKQIDLLITISCTGVIIPSLDAYLINDLGFRSDVRRLPITELGCAAGAAALGRASDYLKAYPDGHVLIVAVELPSLTFQRSDNSPAHLISCVLFGDGAAGAVLRGRPAPGLRVVDVMSHLIPDSLDAMGFDLRDSGFHIVLSKNVPELVKREIGGVAGNFLSRNRLDRAALEFFILHPGGQKLLAFVEEELSLEPRHTAASWKVLEEYGNLSSATVLFVAKEFLAQPQLPKPGDRGLLAAFGPGFNVEMALLEWH